MAKKIICLMLSTGNEIMGETESEVTDDFINIEYPVEVKEYISANGMVAFYAYPFMSYSDDKLFTFNQKHVITTTVPSKDVADYYQKIKRHYKDESTKLSEDDRETIYKLFGNTGGNSIN